MSRVVIELDERHGRLLERVAADERRTPPEVCLEAVRKYLGEKADRPERPTPTGDGIAALRAMIGMVKGGPTDSSVNHDYRPGDPA